MGEPPWIDTPQAPVFTFPAPPPPPRSIGHGEARLLPPKSKPGAAEILSWVFPLVALLAVIGLGVFGTYYRWQQQTSAGIATANGQVQPCPLGLQNYTKCWELDLPVSGEWVRWITPTTMSFTVATGRGVVVRGCNGENYDLSKGNKINSACGYTDYRATDNQTHPVYLGVK